MDKIDSLTFEQAIAYTENFLSQSESANFDNAEFQDALAELISTDNGARGFFVTYLTGDWAIADHPPQTVIQALRDVPMPASEFLVKNLAMSTAMAITHRRHGDELAAQGSDRVQRRTAKLIELVNHPEMHRIAVLMSNSVQSEIGEYSGFLKKWGYDQEQKEAVKENCDRVVGIFE